VNGVLGQRLRPTSRRAPSGKPSAPIVRRWRRAVIEKRRAVSQETLLLFGDAPQDSSERVIKTVIEITGLGYKEL
jgi:hypothetical protein